MKDKTTKQCNCTKYLKSLRQNLYMNASFYFCRGMLQEVAQQWSSLGSKTACHIF